MEIKKIFQYKLPKITLYMEDKLIDNLIKKFYKYDKKANFETIDSLELRLVEFLLEHIKTLYIELEDIEFQYKTFKVALSHSQDNIEKQQIILEFATQIDGFKDNSISDQKAFERWFNFDAVDERFEKSMNLKERELNFCLKRVGVVFGVVIKELSQQQSKDLWVKINYLEVLKQMLAIHIPTPILNSALESFYIVMDNLKRKLGKLEQGMVGDDLLRFLYRVSIQNDIDVWSQSYALQLLYLISEESFLNASKYRLNNPSSNSDDIFVRNRIFLTLSKEDSLEDIYFDILELGSKDKSAFVHQGLLKALEKSKHHLKLKLLKKIIFTSDDSVKAYGFDLLRVVDISFKEYFLIIKEFLEKEFSIYSYRYCMDSLVEYVKYNNKKEIIYNFIELLSIFHNKTSNIQLKIYSSTYILQLYLNRLIEENNYKKLYFEIKKLQNKKTINIPKSNIEDENFLIFLSSLTFEDLPLELHFGLFKTKIFKGEQYTQKFWRFVYETRFTSVDKREAHDHTQGFFYKGKYLFNSNILSEVTPTKVPGQAILNSKFAGWMEFLPLPEQILHSLKNSLFSHKTTFIYTQHGFSSIVCRGNYINRLKSYIYFQFNLHHLAKARFDTVFENNEKDYYSNYLESFGILLSFKSHFKNINSYLQQYFYNKDI